MLSAAAKRARALRRRVVIAGDAGCALCNDRVHHLRSVAENSSAAARALGSAAAAMSAASARRERGERLRAHASAARAFASSAGSSLAERALAQYEPEHDAGLAALTHKRLLVMQRPAGKSRRKFLQALLRSGVFIPGSVQGVSHGGEACYALLVPRQPIARDYSSGRFVLNPSHASTFSGPVYELVVLEHNAKLLDSVLLKPDVLTKQLSAMTFAQKQQYEAEACALRPVERVRVVAHQLYINPLDERPLSVCFRRAPLAETAERLRPLTLSPGEKAVRDYGRMKPEQMSESEMLERMTRVMDAAQAGKPGIVGTKYVPLDSEEAVEALLKQEREVRTFLREQRLLGSVRERLVYRVPIVLLNADSCPALKVGQPVYLSHGVEVVVEPHVRNPPEAVLLDMRGVELDKAVTADKLELPEGVLLSRSNPPDRVLLIIK